ncbi:carboxypeptidase-like regulatory domain-containing protein [Dysgonomonas sp. BGC7]|nr:carboxypeptidase-like regulatory domain-containing protein [Dysgonomonas sp. BGC7]
MGQASQCIMNIKRAYFLFLFLMACFAALAQSPTILKGVVKDASTREKLPFVSVVFDNTSIGTFSDEEGEFRISNRNNQTSVTVSLLGYTSKKFVIHPGVMTTEEIYLEPADKQLNEVVVRPHKEKYSKKNNPAVELIKKVIAHKDSNNITSNDYYQYKEYERIFFALNDFKPDQPQFKRYKFLPQYVDTSLIESKAILPVSVREKITDVYYRKDPKADKRIVKAYQIQGLDQAFETEGLDAIIKEVFKDISLSDNSVFFLFQEFISPLSSSRSIDFYRWYISDTVNIDSERYVKLDFAPFNSRDIGFTGNLYISLDSAYAVKKAVLRTPKKMNINFIGDLVIIQDFAKRPDGRWIPKEHRMAIDLTMLDAVKFYVDKTISYENVVLDKPMNPIFIIAAPEAFEKDYTKRSKLYWSSNRPPDHQKDYKMDQMMEDVNKVLLFKVLLNGGKVIASGYVPTSKDPEENKLDIGTLPTLYSYNSIEGNRLRLTFSTTKNLHPHLYFYGYGAYGTRDEKFKYYAEATWAFNKVENHKDEFPKSNISIAYKYDINTLGQRYTQAERDNIFMSLQTSSNKKLTYNRQTQIAYQKEYYGGFSFKLTGQTFDESPAGTLSFEKQNDAGDIYRIRRIRTTEAMLALRYAPNEKFFQQRRKRNSLTSKKMIFNLSHTIALENIFGGQFHYNKTSFSVFKNFWISPYGKVNLSVQAEKIWGETPFPFLITPSANNSYTIQNGNYYLIEPLEFIHDSQVSWEVYYYMGGWLFNRVPLLKTLKWREVFGFRGFLGELSNRNNPLHNRNLLLFPQETYSTEKGKPYMEYNIGIENILKFFRIDYVRRVNYLGHPNVSKNGFRISFDFTF